MENNILEYEYTFIEITNNINIFISSSPIYSSRLIVDSSLVHKWMEFNRWKQIENGILTASPSDYTPPCCSYFAILTMLYRRTWESRVFHATEGFIEPATSIINDIATLARTHTDTHIKYNAINLKARPSRAV